MPNRSEHIHEAIHLLIQEKPVISGVSYSTDFGIDGIHFRNELANVFSYERIINGGSWRTTKFSEEISLADFEKELLGTVELSRIYLQKMKEAQDRILIVEDRGVKAVIGKGNQNEWSVQLSIPPFNLYGSPDRVENSARHLVANILQQFQTNAS